MKMINFKFQNVIQKLFKPRASYQPLVEVRVFKDAILHNLNEFRKTYPSVSFAPVLKSNAYGHGLWQVGKILDEYNHPHPFDYRSVQALTQQIKREENNAIPFLVVDSFYEALTLRQHGVKTKILILGFTTPEQILSNLKNISVGIISLDQLKLFSKKQKVRIHLKVDTGMHRQGILVSEIPEAIKIIKSNKNLILEGLCSHLADADGETEEFTKKQIALWNETVKKFEKEFGSIKYTHLANTAGSKISGEAIANVSRLGIGLYGFDPLSPSPNPSHKGRGINSGALNLKPALEMVTQISSLRTIPAGEKVGYNITYETKKQTVLATIPVGYNEGVDRRLSNKGFVKIGKNFCPIVGRVSMNITSVDVTTVHSDALAGGLGVVKQEVIVISRNSEDKNSVENIAKLCGTISYEILVHVPQSLRRVVV